MIRSEPVTEVPLRFLSRCAGTLNLVRPWQTQRGDPPAEQLSGVKEEEEEEEHPPPRERGRPVPAVRQLDDPAVEAYARAPHKESVCLCRPSSLTTAHVAVVQVQPVPAGRSHDGTSLRADRRGYIAASTEITAAPP
jgi:hypothetical protein